MIVEYFLWILILAIPDRIFFIVNILDMNEEKKVFCGSEEVSEKEKTVFVKSVFSDVSTKYDLMNNLMSLGMHHLWKRDFVDLMRRCLMYRNNGIVLDVASGTGDIAIKFLKKNQNYRVILSDINSEMLSIARQRLIDENLFNRGFCLINSGERLSFEDEKFDLYTVSFGIRNFSNIEMALKEAYRVLKPYCYFMCMEFSPIEKQGIFSSAYKFYADKVIPMIGEKVAHNKDAYQYLVDSINTFPKKDDFKRMIENVGFKNVQYFEMNCGLVAIHIGQKIV